MKTKILLLAVLFTLSGCASFRETLGTILAGGGAGLKAASEKPLPSQSFSKPQRCTSTMLGNQVTTYCE